MPGHSSKLKLAYFALDTALHSAVVFYKCLLFTIKVIFSLWDPLSRIKIVTLNLENSKGQISIAFLFIRRLGQERKVNFFFNRMQVKCIQISDNKFFSE